MSLSTMNWKRGLLRLWAVAAVLWVCVAFYSNDTVQRVRDVQAHVALRAATLEKMSDAELERIASGHAITPTSLQDFRKRYPEYNDMSDTALAKALHVKFYSEASTIWPPLFDFAALAFIPPVLLLALGYIGLWVGRGFRR